MSRQSRKTGESSQPDPDDQLPFANSSTEEETSSSATTPRNIADSKHLKASSVVSGSHSSYSTRTPARSFFHQASNAPLDTPQYASLGVRERTQELAKYALGSEPVHRSRRFTEASAAVDDPENTFDRWRNYSEGNEPRTSIDSWDDETLPVPLPPQGLPNDRLPVTDAHRDIHPQAQEGKMKQRALSGVETYSSPKLSTQNTHGDERSPLLSKGDWSKPTSAGWVDRMSAKTGFQGAYAHMRGHVKSALQVLHDPETWSSKSMARYGTNTVKTFSAVFLGTLLNILDGLSYGLILFPLGHPIFANTGADGISIYYVSCIVAQLVFSLGATVFKGGVGSEMIEVVPFFHKMTYAIVDHMGEDDPPAVMATVIVSYCLSSILTGIIFLGLGFFNLGNLVSFFPRHILCGAIGGVGFFLFVTGLEVSARLDGNLNYDYETLQKLFSPDTILLWSIPLVLSIAILVIRSRVKSPLVMPAYYTAVAVIFYIVVKGILRSDLDHLRSTGWIFDKPEAGVPFYRFYTYFRFGLVSWGAIVQTIPSMLALSFFGIIHVPINVPALGLAVKEDNVNINRELIAHGLSNTISGCVGSIQNYLVYANSYLVYQNGGDSRAAGLLLAAATTAVWISGPAMIGFIPVCVVGTLIFMLGIELLGEALWDTRGKLHWLEYLTIVVIVLIMGIYDFVVGIVAGILLACLNYVVQSSQTPAIRAKYSGNIAESTVRRPPMDKRYLTQVGSQIRVEKLSGFLFFGSIVAVEDEIKSLIDEESFMRRPVRYVIIDMEHVTGIDFSAAEAFQRMNRIVRRRNVTMVLSGVSFSGDVGKSLNMVGLFDAEQGDEEVPVPRVYEDLNNALEACENELIEVFHRHRLGLATPPTPSEPEGKTKSLAISPPNNHSNLHAPNPLAPAFSSPRGNLLLQAAAHTIEEHGDMDVTPDGVSPIRPRWKHFSQPVRIMLQTFEDVSSQNEDFWHRAAPYFERRAIPSGAVLYSRGDEPDGFYLLESGRFRAEYELEQGNYYEVILPGTTCGELPFFSETDRTSTVAAEQDSVAWLLTRRRWADMERELPDAAKELLKIGLKLTSERMSAITSYVLVMAS